MSGAEDEHQEVAPDASGHLPVMLPQVLALLDVKPGQVVLDCTAGRGGHAAAIVERLGSAPGVPAPASRYIGLDADPENVAFTAARIADFAQKTKVQVNVLHRNFAAARQALDDLGVDRVDGILADLGFASTHVDDPSRGFSFRADGPLDMRLDPTGGTTAAQLVNSLPERELANLIYEYGEERFSRRIAQRIADRRRVEPITTTGQLAEICAAAYGHRRHQSRIDPATRTFQALRIAVNDELNRLQLLLDQAPQLLRPGARLVIISFHSLEDRMVKNAFRDWAKSGDARLLTKKPMTAGEAEVAANPRSRSAKCRGLEWTAGLDESARVVES